MLSKVNVFLFCSISAAASLASNKAPKSGDGCWPEGSIVCSAGFFQICASALWSTKMSLAQGTTCGVFNKSLSAATFEPPPSINGQPLAKDAQVSITRSGFITSIPSDALNSQTTIASGGSHGQTTTRLFSFPTQARSSSRPITSTHYSGPASDFPPSSLWVSFQLLWNLNKSVSELNPEGTAQLINDAICHTASESGVDARIIFAVVLQESTCLLSAITTNNGANNPGLIQSHNGVGYTDRASILQMIKDGTEGTYYQGVKGGDGLRQLISKYGVYGGLRAYNSVENGIDINNLSSASIGTPSYVSDIANKLIGTVIAH